MAVVTLDIAKFREEYPQFDAVPDKQVELAFKRATLIVDNTLSGVIPYDKVSRDDREEIIFLLMCHLLELGLRGAGVVGNLTNASEGTISAGISKQQSGRAVRDWFQQTQCGYLAYIALRRYAIGGIYMPFKNQHKPIGA